MVVEATTGLRMDHRFVLDVYKVLWYLDMLFLGIWVHLYSDMPRLQFGGGFWGFGDRPEPKWYHNVMVEATTGFRLDSTSILDVYKGVLAPWYAVYGHMGPPLQASDWIPHPYWIYIKCFGTLICCVWAYGSTLTVIYASAGRGRMILGFWG